MPSLAQSTFAPHDHHQQRQRHVPRTRSILPQECLAMILRQLDTDRPTLHALLLVNHQFFHLAVPLLYRSPFRLLESKQESWSWLERAHRQVLLLQLLMRAVQIKQADLMQFRLKHPTEWLQRQRQLEDADGSDVPDDYRGAEVRSLSASTAVSHDDRDRKRTLRFNTPIVSKRRQQWWGRRRSSVSTPASSNLPSRTRTSVPSSSALSSLLPLSFSALSLSKKESNVSAVVLGKIRGRTTMRCRTTPFFLNDSDHHATAIIDEVSLHQGSQQYQRPRQPGMDLPFDCGLSTGSTNFVPTPGEYHCQSFWHNSLDTQQQCTTSPESQPLEHADCHSGSQRYSGLYLGPLRPSVRSFESDSSNTFVDDTVEESDEPFSEDEACYCRRDDYYGYSSDSDYDDSSVIDDQCSTDSPSPENSVPLEPYLGPFGPTKETNNLRNWAQAFQQRFGSISGVSNNAGTGDTVRQNPPVSTTSTRLMTDYLAHYVEHDHPRLARILPGLFPSLPAECFDQIQTSRVCSRTSQSTGGQGPPGHAVLNIFQSLQQSHKNVQNLERAHATRIRVERDLLHHSPQRIRTLSLSAARVHAITLPPVHPRQTSPVKARSRSSIVSPLPSLLSLLPSSLFSKSPVTPVSSGSSWHSSESSSTVFSYRSYHSTASSSFSAESLSWTNVPPLSKLGRLYRIELHDIYHGIDIDAVVDFLELHDKTFHTIREIKVGGADDLGRASDPRVIMILRCLRTVKALDMVEWREAIKFMDRIPTKHLETLLLGNVRMTNVESGGTSTSASNDSTDEQVHPQIRTLQRCRLLREVRMPVLIERLFEWAVKERQERLLLRPLPTALFSLDLGSRSSLVKQKDQPYWDNDRDRRRPVQLENVHLSGTSTGPLISTLLHIVDAFRDSLQVLQSTSWLDSTEAPFSCQNLSWSWCLPQLQILELQGEIAYRLRIQTLQNCPQLRVLRLSLPHSVLPSSPVRPTLATESQPHSPCQRCQCVSQLPTISLADYFCPKDDYTEAKRTAPICPHKLDIEEHRWHPGKRQEQPHNKPALFPRLQELKLAGDWGLQDESLLRMAETMPQLTRLSLLRCESDTLTARGLILALPSLLRRNQNQGQNPSHNGNRRECRLQWLEVSKTWQSELDAAMADRENYGVLNDAIDKRGTWPLQVLYQY